MDYKNPFIYESANKLTAKQIADFYIPDYNYSRFLQSRRNIFLEGERGTGKTMTLLYNSLPVRKEMAKNSELDLSVALR